MLEVGYLCGCAVAAIDHMLDNAKWNPWVNLAIGVLIVTPLSLVASVGIVLGLLGLVTAIGDSDAKFDEQTGPVQGVDPVAAALRLGVSQVGNATDADKLPV
jgi:hypothetical protein